MAAFSYNQKCALKGKVYVWGSVGKNCKFSALFQVGQTPVLSCNFRSRMTNRISLANSGGSFRMWQPLENMIRCVAWDFMDFVDLCRFVTSRYANWFCFPWSFGLVKIEFLSLDMRESILSFSWCCPILGGLFFPT